jgi:hypothetical protein
MGFNRRKMDGKRRQASEKEAAARRALDPLNASARQEGR